MSVVFKATAPDVLSDVLGTLRLRGHVFCVTDMSSPWAMRLPAGVDPHFHVIVRGVAWLRVPRDRVPVRLQTGDLVVLPHGSGHVLSDGSDTTPLLLTDLLARRPAHDHVLRHGGAGAQTHMICGAFEFENRGDNPIETSGTFSEP